MELIVLLYVVMIGSVMYSIVSIVIQFVSMKWGQQGKLGQPLPVFSQFQALPGLKGIQSRWWCHLQTCQVLIAGAEVVKRANSTRQLTCATLW